MWILLRGYEIVEVRLLGWRGVEQEQHAVEARGGIDDSLIELLTSQGIHIAMERDHPRLVDGA